MKKSNIFIHILSNSSRINVFNFLKSKAFLFTKSRILPGVPIITWLFLLRDCKSLLIFVPPIKQAENNFAKNLGHNLHKKCKIVSFGSN